MRFWKSEAERQLEAEERLIKSFLDNILEYVRRDKSNIWEEASRDIKSMSGAARKLEAIFRRLHSFYLSDNNFFIQKLC